MNCCVSWPDDCPTGDGVLTLRAGDVVGFTARRPDHGDTATIALGLALPLSELPRSKAAADRVFDAAWKRPAGGVFSLEDLTWRTAAGDPDVTAVLRQRYLAPFAADADFGRIVLGFGAELPGPRPPDFRSSQGPVSPRKHPPLPPAEIRAGHRCAAGCHEHYRRALLGLRGMPGSACGRVVGIHNGGPRPFELAP